MVVNELGQLCRHRPPRVVSTVVATLQSAWHVSADILQVHATDCYQFQRVRVTEMILLPDDEVRRNDHRQSRRTCQSDIDVDDLPYSPLFHCWRPRCPVVVGQCGWPCGCGYERGLTVQDLSRRQTRWVSVCDVVSNHRLFRATSPRVGSVSGTAWCSTNSNVYFTVRGDDTPRRPSLHVAQTSATLILHPNFQSHTSFDCGKTSLPKRSAPRSNPRPLSPERQSARMSKN